MSTWSRHWPGKSMCMCMCGVQDPGDCTEPGAHGGTGGWGGGGHPDMQIWVKTWRIRRRRRLESNCLTNWRCSVWCTHPVRGVLTGRFFIQLFGCAEAGEWLWSVCGGLDWGSAGFQCSVMEKGSVAVRLLPLMKESCDWQMGLSEDRRCSLRSAPGG